MENEVKEKGKGNILIIAILCLLLGVAGGYIIATSLNKSDKSTNGEPTNNTPNDLIEDEDKKENKDENTNTIVQYKDYIAGQEIVLNNGSKWLVINNGEDYVTAIIATPKDELTDYSDYDSNALMGKYETALKTYVERQLIKFNDIKLKNNDIRLITSEEYMSLYGKNNWRLENNSYYYTGANTNMINTLTMTESGCTGKCGNFYLTGITDKGETILTSFSNGNVPARPVLNIMKSEIK